jgi:hypothetical protein
MYDWSLWRTLVPLIIGVFSLIGFIIYSAYILAEPLIRGTLFNTSTIIAAYISTLVQGLIVWSLLYYMPLYFEVVKNYSPITFGITMFPFTFTITPAAVIIGLIVTKTSRYRPSLWIRWFYITLGIGLFIYLN